MVRPPHVHRFLQGRRRIVESYQACWHGRCFPQEKLCVRVDRYCDRYDIAVQIFEQDEQGDWQPARTQARPLTPDEWQQVTVWLAVGFWQQPNQDASSGVLDGDSWRIQGYREGSYHEVYRHTGSLIAASGAEVYELGRRLASLAGIRRFEETQEE